VFGFVLPVFLLAHSLDSKAQDGSFDGATLTLPIVAVFNPKEIYDQYFAIEFVLQPETTPGDLVLTSAMPLPEAPGTGAIVASYRDGILTVPSVNVGGTFYWGTFTIINDNPVTFRLTTADFNDEDDDNDGFPDSVDGLPFAAAGNMDPLGIEGAWDFTVTVTAASGGCDGEEGSVRNERVIFEFDSITDSYNARGSNNADAPIPTYHNYGPVNIVGSYMTYSGEFQEGGGDTFSNLFINLRDEDMLGHEWWTWSTENTLVCPDGRASVTAVRHIPNG